MTIKTINMKEFTNEYNKQYDFIYKCNEKGSEVAGEKEALNYFSSNITEQEQEILKEFSKYRMDILSSDREIIAFMFAVDKFIE